jgi:hypothetical protein
MPRRPAERSATVEIVDDEVCDRNVVEEAGRLVRRPSKGGSGAEAGRCGRNGVEVAMTASGGRARRATRWRDRDPQASPCEEAVIAGRDGPVLARAATAAERRLSRIATVAAARVARPTRLGRRAAPTNARGRPP